MAWLGLKKLIGATLPPECDSSGRDSAGLAECNTEANALRSRSPEAGRLSARLHPYSLLRSGRPECCRAAHGDAQSTGRSAGHLRIFAWASHACAGIRCCSYRNAWGTRAGTNAGYWSRFVMVEQVGVWAMDLVAFIWMYFGRLYLIHDPGE